MHGASIAVEQEPRQRRRQDHRVTNDHIANGATDPVLGPCDRHHARGAGEIRNVEDDLGGAVGFDCDNTGIERERLLCGRRALQLGRRIASGPDLAARTLHAVDQLAVEIADIGGEPTLAEIVVVGRGRLVVGQIQNPDVDRGDDDPCVLSGGEPAHLHRDAQRAVGPQQRRQGHVERKRARLAIDRKPLHADGPAGHAFRPGVERPAKRGDHIGAAPPIVADRDAQPRRARRHILRDRGGKPVPYHVQRDLAGGARGHGDRHVLARRVFRLIECDFEQVGRVGARLRIPAGIEIDRGRRAVAVRGRHFEAIAAPLHRNRDARRLVGGNVNLAIGDPFGRFCRLEIPGAVAAVPLILGLDLQQFVTQAVPRQRCSVRRGEHHIEGGVLALAERSA